MECPLTKCTGYMVCCSQINREKGGENVLKISEREDAKANLICIRDDGLVPSEEEYEKWQEEHKEGQIAVESIHKMVTTWSHTRSAY